MWKVGGIFGIKIGGKAVKKSGDFKDGRIFVNGPRGLLCIFLCNNSISPFCNYDSTDKYLFDIG